MMWTLVAIGLLGLVWSSLYIRKAWKGVNQPPTLRRCAECETSSPEAKWFENRCPNCDEEEIKK